MIDIDQDQSVDRSRAERKGLWPLNYFGFSLATFRVPPCRHAPYHAAPRQDMPRDVFYTVENMRLEEGEIEAFLIDVVAGGWVF